MKGGPRARVSTAMLRMRKARGVFAAQRGHGFTIIEVMIVLAVTGALFVSAALLIAGRQQQTQFDQSIREVQSQIQQVINEIGHGFYPNSGDFSCEAGSSGPPTFTGAAAGQGTNEGCIFLGKAIQFGVADTDPEIFDVMTIAGRQKSESGQEAATLAEAQPRVVGPATGAPLPPGTPNATISNPLLYGLTTAWADAGVIAFVSNLSDITSPVGTSVQQPNVIAVEGTSLGMTPEAAAGVVNENLASSPQNPADGVRICFASGGTDQSGLITIGGPGRGLAVNLDIMNGRTCGT